MQSDQKPFVLVSHAKDRMADRHISMAWVSMVLEQPEVKARQEERETRWRLWRKIPENGDRTLCVIVDEYDDRYEIVTVFFDRRIKR